MKIEKPDRSDWGELMWSFNHWFKEKVEPVNEMIANGIEVYNFEEIWHPMRDAYGDDKPSNKALLINIEPIKKETAEDVLRDILRMYLENGSYMNKDLFIFKQRAKAVLEEK